MAANRRTSTGRWQPPGIAGVSAAIATGELAPLIGDLIDALGGEARPIGA